MKLSECANSWLIGRLHQKFRPRDKHHSNCDSRKGKSCDCYASGSQEAHDILDELERRLALKH